MDIQKQLNLRMQLQRLVKEKVTRHGLAMDTRCDGQMQRMLIQAAERMAAANAIDRVDKVQMVQEDLEIFMDTMEKHARELGTFPRVSARAFTRARTELSPLWPLC